MSLNDKLKSTTLEHIRQLDLVKLTSYRLANHEILKNLYDSKIIDNESIERALDIAVQRQAINDYEWLLNDKKLSGAYADDLGYPEYLAHGIIKGVFSEKELSKIPLTHDETLDSFVKLYSKPNLIESLRNKILTKPESIATKYPDNDLCCCEF